MIYDIQFDETQADPELVQYIEVDRIGALGAAIEPSLKVSSLPQTTWRDLAPTPWNLTGLVIA